MTFFGLKYRVRIWRTVRHTLTKNAREYPPGDVRRSKCGAVSYCKKGAEMLDQDPLPLPDQLHMGIPPFSSITRHSSSGVDVAYVAGAWK